MIATKSSRRLVKISGTGCRIGEMGDEDRGAGAGQIPYSLAEDRLAGIGGNNAASN